MNQLKVWMSWVCIYLSGLSWMTNNWVSVWMIMEVTVLFMVGLMSLNSSYSGSSMMMKIFIIQLLISLAFMLFSLIYIMNIFMVCSFICLILLFMKLGLFPFHVWMISVVGKMNWLTFFILNSFIKLPPLVLTYTLLELSNFTSIIVATAVMGGCMGINNVISQKLLIYSSMVHITWILMSLTLSLSIFCFYYIMYIFTLMLISLFFYNINLFYLNQLKLATLNKFYVFSMTMVVLSLGGFPPFVGFIMKWIVGSFMLYCNLKMVVFIMIGSSFLSVSFYFQLIYYLVLIYSSSLKWHYGIYLSYIKSLVIFFVLTFYLLIYLNI